MPGLKAAGAAYRKLLTDPGLAAIIPKDPAAKAAAVAGKDQPKVVAAANRLVDAELAYVNLQLGLQKELREVVTRGQELVAAAATELPEVPVTAENRAQLAVLRGRVDEALTELGTDLNVMPAAMGADRAQLVAVRLGRALQRIGAYRDALAGAKGKKSTVAKTKLQAQPSKGVQVGGVTERRDGNFVEVVGDLLAQDVDAIVNAAREDLGVGLGIDGAINGLYPGVNAEARQQLGGSLGAGTAVAVDVRRHKKKHDVVVQTVGPTKDLKGTEKGVRLLRDAVVSSIRAAEDAGATTLAFSAISYGYYGWGPDAVEVIRRTIRNTTTKLTEIRLVHYDGYLGSAENHAIPPDRPNLISAFGNLFLPPRS